MWSTTLANLKENLNKIALDVHDEDDDDEADKRSEISNSRYSFSFSDRRFSHNSARSVSVSDSPVANGFDSPSNSEIEQYRAEIKRLQESEAQIKALSVNYAALLKEREDQISRLNEENGSLKQNVRATQVNMDASRNESFKASTSSPTVLRGSDQSPNRQQKASAKNRSSGYPSQNGVISKQETLGNGVAHSMQPDGIRSKIESGNSPIESKEKELADLLEEKNRSMAAMQATHGQQIKLLGVELDKERGKLANMESRLQEEQKLNRSLQEEQNSLKVEKNKLLAEMNQIREELNKKSSEIRHLQTEINRRDNPEAGAAVESLKRVVATLEKENNNLKMERDELRGALEAPNIASAHKSSSGGSETSNKLSNGVSEVQSSGDFPGKEEMELSLQKLEKDLKEACREKDKALHQLNRLKQHLLDKESEESEKMDEDSKIIEELRENNEYLRAQVRHLEKSLTQAIASQEEVEMTNSNELQKSKELIDDLNGKLTSVTSTIETKNVELLNLQTALGQYYAEIEAKEHLEGDLVSARQESARLSALLKDLYEQAEISKKEKEELLAKLLQAEKMITEGKSRVNKLEEDNGKLRRALEQSMTRLNRMSMDSDYSVDRRIVIKLLVTYFQRNHSKEVLDLMVRMLGFSEEDKQRIGVAQQGASKGVVRGVFGLPGRLVGGILGGSPTEVHANMAASDNQSFADMWVDFLLKETEERERREAQATGGSSGNQQITNPTGTASPSLDRRSNPSLNHYQSPPSSHGSLFLAEHAETASPVHDQRSNPSLNHYQSPPSSHGSLFQAEHVRRSNPSLNQPYQSPPSSHGSLYQAEHSDSEFSTVPLTSSDSNSRLSRLFPGY